MRYRREFPWYLVVQLREGSDAEGKRETEGKAIDDTEYVAYLTSFTL